MEEEVIMKKEAAVPRYKLIEKDILDKMNSQYYKTGSAIPTEKELAEEYQVSRVTVRKATDSLVLKGLLKRVAGSGTYVQESPAHQKFPRQIGFSKEMEKLGMVSKTEVNSFSIIPADNYIAKLLKINENDMIYYIERSRYGDDLLLQFEISYMPVKYFPDLSISYLETSKYDYIENIRNMKIDCCHHQDFPILPTQEMAKSFHIDVNVPIMKIINTTYSTDGKIIDYTIQYLNSPNYQLNYIRTR